MVKHVFIEMFAEQLREEMDANPECSAESLLGAALEKTIETVENNLEKLRTVRKFREQKEH